MTKNPYTLLPHTFLVYIFMIIIVTVIFFYRQTKPQSSHTDNNSFCVQVAVAWRACMSETCGKKMFMNFISFIIRIYTQKPFFSPEFIHPCICIYSFFSLLLLHCIFAIRSHVIITPSNYKWMGELSLSPLGFTFHDACPPQKHSCHCCRCHHPKPHHTTSPLNHQRK